MKNGIEWTVDVEKGSYKGSKPYSFGHDFEFTLGKRNEVDVENVAFTLENNTKEIRDKSLKSSLRTNDSFGQFVQIY